jgi:hypothetical protein
VVVVTEGVEGSWEWREVLVSEPLSLETGDPVIDLQGVTAQGDIRISVFEKGLYQPEELNARIGALPLLPTSSCESL